MQTATKGVFYFTIMADNTRFHSYIIKGVYNKKTDESGWRIVGLWGEEEKGEGNRIGPTFKESELEDCEKLADELESKLGLPVLISDVLAFFAEKGFIVTINHN